MRICHRGNGPGEDGDGEGTNRRQPGGDLVNGSVLDFREICEKKFREITWLVEIFL